MSVDIEPTTAVEAAPEPEAPDALEVRRDGALSGVVGLSAAGVAVAWLQRAVGTDAALDWLVCGALGVVALVHLALALDGRVPLVVVDGHGVRLRRGRQWEGLAWGDLDHVEHRPRTSMLRDGRLAFVTSSATEPETGLRPPSVRLSLSTRLVGADWHQLTDALVELADGRAEVHELVTGEVEETPVEQVVLAEPERTERTERRPVPAARHPRPDATSTRGAGSRSGATRRRSWPRSSSLLSRTPASTPSRW